MMCTIYAPWFGNIPFYGATFLYCCGLSKNIQWVIHSDQQKPDYCPDNVNWTTIDLNDFRTRLLKIFNFLHIPDRQKWGHKLCDLKPFWHRLFDIGSDTPYVGWCDWDIVHNLSELDWKFTSAKFTTSSLCAPLFIQKTSTLLEVYPTRPYQMLANPRTVSWCEHYYMPQVTDSTIMQSGMTPEVDLIEPVKYVVHMYKGKHDPKLYKQWTHQYLQGWDQFGCEL